MNGLKIRSFASAVEFYYYNKMLQIPLMILCNYCKIPLSTAIEYLFFQKNYETISKVNKMFYSHPKSILKGGHEFIKSKRWLNIYWPPGEYAMIKLFELKKINQFYEESFSLLRDLSENKIPIELLENAISYNKFLLKKPQSFVDDNSLKLNYDLPNIVSKIKLNTVSRSCYSKIKIKLNRKCIEKYSYKEWAKKVIWYGHRSSAYFYGNKSIQKDIAGHH